MQVQFTSRPPASGPANHRGRQPVFAGKSQNSEKAGFGQALFRPAQLWNMLLARLRGEKTSAQSAPRLTALEHEPDFRFNAPHHFTVKEAGTGRVVSRVDFQEGPVKENGLNGVQNEDLLEMVITRLRSFQDSAFACRENAAALKKLEEALAILNARTARRLARGVEGTSRH